MSSSLKIPILYIDDEQVNLLAFRANFRRDYEVHTATNGEDGKKLIEEHNIKIVVADQRMPKMTGVQFFEWIRKDHPDTVRILLTGFSDIQAVIDAINKGQIYSYITKPWHEDELKQTFEAGIEVSRRKQHLINLDTYFQHLFETSSDAILQFDKGGSVARANPSALELFGYSNEEISSIELNQLFDGIDSLDELLTSEKKNDQVVFNKFQESITCDMSLVTSPTDGDQGQFLQVVLQR